jgi:tetratricopeptide (TPR) repeat protein
MKKNKSVAAQKGSKRPYLWLIVSVAVIVRLIYISEIKPLPFFLTPVGDEAAYHKTAQLILSGDILAGKRAFYQDPLYPYFLASVYMVFGDSVIVPKTIQLFAGIGSCLLIYLISQMVFGLEEAVIAGFMSSVYPLFYFFEAQLLKSSLVVFFTLVLFYLLLKYRDTRKPSLLFFAGLSQGLDVASQGHSYFFIPFIVLWLFTLSPDTSPLVALKSKIKMFAIFLAGMSVVIVPITVRNYMVSKDFVLVTYQGGTNFFIGNNKDANGIYVPLREGRELPPYEEIDAVELAQKESGRTLHPSEVSTFWFHKGLRYIIDNPAGYAKLLAEKTFLFLNKLEISDVVDYYFIKDQSWLFNIPFLHFGCIIPLAVAGLMLGWKEKEEKVVLLYYFALAAFLSLILFYVFSRYRLQGIAFFIILAAHGLIVIKRHIVNHRYKKLLFIAPALCIFLYISNRSNTIISQGLGYGLMGDMCMQKKQYDQALKYFIQALKRKPNDFSVQVNLHWQVAKCLFELRDFDKSLIEFSHVLAIEQLKNAPQFEDIIYSTKMSMGIIYRIKNDYPRALEIFSELRTTYPDRLPVRISLSTVYKKLNKNKEAFRELAYVVERDSMNIVALNNIANLYRDTGSYGIADTYYQKCLTIDPSNTVVHKNIERMHEMQKGGNRMTEGGIN